LGYTSNPIFSYSSSCSGRAIIHEFGSPLNWPTRELG